MHIDKLIHMANQIGAFFEAMPDHDEAVEGIAQHLKKFWEPRMRRELLAQLDTDASLGLHAMVREAMESHRAILA